MIEAEFPLELGNLIGGRRVVPQSSSASPMTHANPSNGEPLLIVPRGSAAEVRSAVDAALVAQPIWESKHLQQRSELLLEAAGRLEAAVERLAYIDALETGKPLALARSLAGGAALHIRDFVAATHGFIDQPLGADHRQLYDAHGVVAIVVPWNAAVEVVMRTLPAALLLGNTVVIKPSERAPWAVRELAETLDLPPGVVNVVVGDASAGQSLIEDPRVRLVIHTGSVASGRSIARVCAEQLKPAILELGGKDPILVDRDVDIEWAAATVALGSWINAGQLCTAIERIYVDEFIAADFIDALAEHARAETVGPGLDDRTTVGPLIDERMRVLVAEHVDAALASGARAVVGGAPLPGPGFFYPPTVLVDAPDDSPVMVEETFGPIAPVRVVSNLDDAVSLANRGKYGLAATVLTNRPEGVVAARRLKAGTVWVNAYLAGTPGGRILPRGESGLGVVGDRRAVLEAIGAPRVLHLARGSAELDINRNGPGSILGPQGG